MTISAYVVKREALDTEVSEDMTALRDAVDWLETEGYEAGTISKDTALGWLAHKSETDTEAGTLYFWEAPEGGPDRYMLKVTLSDGAVWIDATKEADDD